MMMLLAATSPGSGGVATPGPLTTGYLMDPVNWDTGAVTRDGDNLRFDTNANTSANLPLDSLTPGQDYVVSFDVVEITGAGSPQSQIAIVTTGVPIPHAATVNPVVGSHVMPFTTPVDVTDLKLHMSGDPQVLILLNFLIELA